MFSTIIVYVKGKPAIPGVRSTGFTSLGSTVFVTLRSGLGKSSTSGPSTTFSSSNVDLKYSSALFARTVPGSVSSLTLTKIPIVSDSPGARGGTLQFASDCSASKNSHTSSSPNDSIL